MMRFWITTLACQLGLSIITADLNGLPAQTVRLADGRVFFRAGSMSVERTFSLPPRAIEAALSNDQRTIAVVLDTPGDSIETGRGRQARTELWLVDAQSARSRRILRGHDSKDGEALIAGLSHPAFSPDNRTVYVESVAWMVSSALHAVNAMTGAERFVCQSNGYEVLVNGRHRGELLVWQHRYTDHPLPQAYDAAWLMTSTGRTVKRIALDNAPDVDRQLALVRAGRDR